MSGFGRDLSIAIPAYNEEDRLGLTLDRIAAWAAKEPRTIEIVVVDDGSSDRTFEVATMPRGLDVQALRLPGNRGKGAALRAAVAATRGDLVLITDADLSTPIEEIGRLEDALEGVDIAIGSRVVSGANVVERQALWRQGAGKLFNLLIRMLGASRFADTQCGFKLLRGSVARELFARLTVDRYAFDVELLWLAERLGYGVREVGVVWRNDAASRVRLWRDGTRMLIDTVRFRGRHRGTPRGRPLDAD